MCYDETCTHTTINRSYIHISAFRHCQLKHSAEAALDANSIVSEYLLFITELPSKYESENSKTSFKNKFRNTIYKEINSLNFVQFSLMSHTLLILQQDM